MNRSLLSVSLAATLAALGCSAPSSAPIAPGSGEPGATLAGITPQQAALAIYDLTVDPAAVSASFDLVERRSGQATDDVYALSVSNFLRPSSLTVTSVTETATTIDLGYTFTHPFNAPSDLAAPATAANRADLGISGQLLMLQDAPGPGYFGGSVIADTSLVANADGFMQPAGLLTLDPGMVANAFPYKLLVDESLDSRTGSDGTPRSNGGLMIGNYDEASGGWQQSNMGGMRDAWAGYGVLHQGQSASNTLSLDKAALTGGPFTFRTALIATYNDPRGGANSQEKRRNRLPKSPADVFAFTYRMPHGALDVEAIAFVGEGGGFITNQITASTLRFRVRDWDARAIETLEADLANDPLVASVAQGESGPPTLSVSIPDVLGTAIETFDNGTDLLDDDSTYGGDAGPDSGRPGDALFYERSVTKTVVSGQTDGVKTGMVRAVDIEAGLDTSAWQFGLDESLTPLATPPIPETFQAFEVFLAGPSSPPTVTLTVTTLTVGDGGTAQVQASGYSDPELDPIEVRIDWNDDGDYNDSGESGNMLSGSGGSPVNFVSPITYIWSGSDPDTRDLPAQYTDNISSPVNVPGLTFTVVEAGLYCPVSAPWTNPPTFAAAWASTPNVIVARPDQPGPTIPEWDYASFKVPTFDFPAPATNAGWVAQWFRSAPSFEMARIYANNPTNFASGFSWIPLTNAPATFGSSVATQRQVHQVEVDTTNRIIFARRNPGVASGIEGDGILYPSASPGFVWFNSDGGATLATDANMTTVATSQPVIALALGINDDVFVVDAQHMLRHYVKATNYTEDTAAPYPINLGGAPYNITYPGRCIYDFDISRYSGAIFLLAEDTAGVEYLYRIECDGSFQNPISGTSNPNPFPHQFIRWSSVNTDDVRDSGPDIQIDQWDTTGAPIGDDADGQILIVGYGAVTTGAIQQSNDFWVFSSQLALTGASNSTGVPFRGGINTQNNWLVTRSGSLIDNLRFWGGPPAGWQ